jgi:hypothetical protein
LLPLIVIGADDRTVEAFQQCPVPIQPCRFHEDTEAAVYALNDELAAAVQLGHPSPELVEFDGARNAWKANVAYGPTVLGRAATGQPVKLPHTGWTLVLAWGLGDPAKPRRVADWRPSEPDQSTLVWQAGPMLAANFVIDLAVPDSGEGLSFPGLVRVLAQMRERVEP